jgi:hypothetical protein
MALETNVSQVSVYNIYMCIYLYVYIDELYRDSQYSKSYTSEYKSVEILVSIAYFEYFFNFIYIYILYIYIY